MSFVLMKNKLYKKVKIKKCYLDAGNMMFAKGGPKNQFFHIDRFLYDSTCL